MWRTRRYFHEKSHYIWPNLFTSETWRASGSETEDLEVPYYFAACHMSCSPKYIQRHLEFVIRHSPVTTLSAWKYDVVCQGTLEMVKLFHQNMGSSLTRAKVQNLFDMASFNHMDREKVEIGYGHPVQHACAQVANSHFSSILKNAIPDLMTRRSMLHMHVQHHQERFIRHKMWSHVS